MDFCPLHKAFVPFDTDYPTDLKSEIPMHLRASGINDRIPTPVPNGGLYNAPQATGPYASIPVAPTGTNMTYYNLRSANPPPGAITQFQGTNRLGNNYTAMPGVYWLNDSQNDHQHKYRIHVTH